MSLVASNLSGFKLDVAEWDSAIYYGRIGLELADASSDRYILAENHKRLAQAYHEVHDFKNAYFHDQVQDSLNKLITSAEVQKNMDELHIQYETEKRERELMKERYANQRKSFWLIGSSGGILALLLAILLLYRSEREKKKRLLATAQVNLESERNRISMDLHDHLGAELSVITSRLDTQAFRSEDVAARSELNRLADQAREANAQLRETIWSVRKTEVTLEQLAHKVRDFAMRNLEESGIRFELRRKGQADLTPAQGLDLFRVLQEGINNARKYSGATFISLQMQQEGNQLSLVLSDNGKGFVQEDIRPGYGMQNMEERISNLGGSFQLTTEKGTVIRIFVPLKA